MLTAVGEFRDIAVRKEKGVVQKNRQLILQHLVKRVAERLRMRSPQRYGNDRFDDMSDVGTSLGRRVLSRVSNNRVTDRPLEWLECDLLVAPLNMHDQMR